MIQIIIKQEIEKATVDNPISSTKLIAIVKEQTSQSISSRRIRSIVADLREKDLLPILATRKGNQGYYLCRNASEFDQYEAEIRNHALKELTTIKTIKGIWFNTSQQELIFI